MVAIVCRHLADGFGRVENTDLPYEAVDLLAGPCFDRQYRDGIFARIYHGGRDHRLFDSACRVERLPDAVPRIRIGYRRDAANPKNLFVGGSGR